jgi:lysozyme
MNVSDPGRAFIKSFESYRSMPYQDEGGKPTVGWGHEIQPDEDFTNGITMGQADDLFIEDLAEKAEHPVTLAIQVSVSQQEFDAMCSLCYNIGAGNFDSSTLVRLLNQGATVDRIATEFGRWDHVNGQVSEGLSERRAAEADIFLNGNYADHA